MDEAIIIASFGGPRSLEEIFPFLESLLCDKDVVLTSFPQKLHNFLFSKIAKKRAGKIQVDYELIGGKSPIFESVKKLEEFLEKRLQKKVFVFHRYLPATHSDFLKNVETFQGKRLLVFPLFPQFSFATSGSIARFFEKNLSGEARKKLVWIPSYPAHLSFISAYAKNIEMTLIQENLKQEEVYVVCSFHGIPIKLAAYDDPYPWHCNLSFEALKKLFPNMAMQIAYQSKFGKLPWLEPATQDLVENPPEIFSKKAVLFVPLSFTSDHIETLFEIESQYVGGLREKGIRAYRVPAIENDLEWAASILESPQSYVSNTMMIRPEKAPLEEELFQKDVQENAGKGACR